MNLADFLLEPGRDGDIAIVSGNTRLTYAQLRQQVQELGWALAALAPAKGDRIGVFAENGPFFVAAYLAVIKLGAVLVPLAADATSEQLQKIASDAGLRGVLVSDRLACHHDACLKKLGLWLWRESDHASRPATDSAPAPQINEGVDLAAILFTSGSTGVPKGVMLSHRNIVCNTEHIIAYMELARDDRIMVVLPFHYCFGLSLLHTALRTGAAVVLNNDFKLYPEKVLEEMLKQGCTGLAGVPSTYQILLRRSRFRQMAFPALRWFQQAGGRLPTPCIEEVLAAFPKVRYFTMYGQTEATARLSYLPPRHLSTKLGSIGKGLPSTRLEVLKSDGQPVVPGSQEVGQIVASGDNVALGYWNDPVETAAFFRQGKLYTGDMARVDSEGFIFIVDRERDMIKPGGNRVSPKEIEDVIARIQEIVEVAVVGSSHELLGESITAFVVVALGSALSAETVKRTCREHLAAFKVPRDVIFVKSLPHNSSGKVLKAKLREVLKQGKPLAGGTLRLATPVEATTNQPDPVPVSLPASSVASH